jgi:hypothetical protein
MKLVIHAEVEETPISAQFDIDIPKPYDEVVSKGVKIISVVAEAVEQVREALRKDEQS